MLPRVQGLFHPNPTSGKDLSTLLRNNCLALPQIKLPGTPI